MVLTGPSTPSTPDGSPDELRPPSLGRPPVTSRDIADIAGVSQSTVSRVVNSFPFVKPSTRDRVLRAMAQLDYVPNAAARSLITHQTRLVGLLISNVVSHAGASVLDTISSRAGDLGYAIVLSNLHEHSDRQAELLDLLQQYRVDGVIAHVDLAGAELPANRLAFPLVLANAPGSHDLFDSISLDYEHATSSVTAHLLGHGRRRLAYIGGAQGDSPHDARMRGFAAALDEVGAVPSDDLVVTGASTQSFGYASIARLIASGTAFDAVVTTTDDVAVGVLDALADHMLRVPQDISVAAIGDTPIAELRSVSLTAFTSDTARIGEGALELLLDRLELRYDGPPRHILIRGHLALRRSCGCG